MDDTLRSNETPAIGSVAIHWPEVCLEAFGLGLFMVSAGVFGTLLEFPGSPLNQAIGNAFARRAVMGALMGATATGLVYSPWGKRSGAHLNPTVTLTFLYLGRVPWRDAMAYGCAQFAGGLAGVLLVAAAFGDAFLRAPVQAVATLPGTQGLAIAFSCEVAMSFILMRMVLSLGRSTRLSPYTGWFVGALLCLYITFEAPLSGMSLNPARSLASAIVSRRWDALWIYFLAPAFGMLSAAELERRLQKRATMFGCAKLCHHLPCLFCGGQAAR
jgi:aquaporin Z